MKHSMQKVQKGFTLIELMIVVAIIGILAAVALPAYQDYISKAKFSEVVIGTSAVKTAVELCVQDGQAIANCDSDTQGIPASYTTGVGHLKELSVTDGVITAKANTINGLSGQTYVLNPTVTDGKVTWTTDPGSTCLPKLCK